MLPLRELFVLFGANVQWDGTTESFGYSVDWNDKYPWVEIKISLTAVLLLGRYH
ncbi:hypothetical protein [Paenibacillus psychroresistens]|uniref:hypothetical protein n=1 Tax=Paenibacillus psychroresistens TaxID=1778678 RepID=UPI00139070AF|nr:hypothetical protein [Paenibacillus psychroresistens]